MSEEKGILIKLNDLENKLNHLTELGETANQRMAKMEKIVFGNGEMGTVDKMRILWFHHKEKHSDMNKLLNFTYRTLIALAIGYIAVKTGIK